MKRRVIRGLPIGEVAGQWKGDCICLSLFIVRPGKIGRERGHAADDMDIAAEAKAKESAGDGSAKK